jgi:hypothetical protein
MPLEALMHAVDLTHRSELVICGSCAGLSGPIVASVAFGDPIGPAPRFRSPDGHYLECTCERALPWAFHHVRPITNPKINPHWETGGFRTPRRFLCCTCAAVLCEDRSRWSPLHCAPCRGAVAELNRSAGRLVIPVGKHSIVNGVFVRADDPDGPTRLSEALRHISAGRETLAEWVRVRARMLLDRAAVPTGLDVPLREYLDTAQQVGGRDSPAALADLLTYLGHRPDIR